MKKISFEVPNPLPTSDAKERISSLFEYWSTKYGIVSSWNGNKASLKGKAMGFIIEADLEILADRVAGSATDPGMLMRGQAKKYLSRKFHQYLSGDSDEHEA